MSSTNQPPEGVGEIAHELSNALTSVLGFAEIIAEDARSGNVSPRDADQLLAATQAAVALVRSLRGSGPAAAEAPHAATAPDPSEEA